MSSFRTLVTVHPARQLAVLVAVVMVGAILPGLASAEPELTVEELKQRVTELTTEVDQLEQRADQLAEDYLVAAAELDELAESIKKKEVSVTQAETDVAKNRAAIKEIAVEAFTGEPIKELESGTSTNVVSNAHRRAFLEVANADKTQTLDNASAVGARLEREVAGLEALKAEAEALKLAADADRQNADQAFEESQALLETASGELAAGIASERAAQQRQRAEAAAAAAAEPAALASRSVARRSNSNNSSNNNSQDAVTSSSPAVASRATAPTTAAPARANAVPQAPAPAPTPVAAPAPAPAPVAAPAPAPVSTPAPSSGAAPTAREIAVQVAMAQRGDPYRWAGSGPNSFDCSGLVQYSFGKAGVSLPHSSRALKSASRRLSKSELIPGDLVFFGSPVYHVGIYIGGDNMVHAPRAGKNVSVVNMHYVSRSISYGRI